MTLHVYYVGIIDDWYGWRPFSERAPTNGLSNATEDKLYRRFILAGAAARHLGRRCQRRPFLGADS